MNQSTMIRSALLALGVAVAAAALPAQKPVQVRKPLRTSLADQTRLPGRVIGEARLELKARVTGYLAEVPVDYGSEVGRGDLLARIDVPDLEARRAQREAALAAAAAGVGDAEAALEVARARVGAAQGGIEVADTEARLAEIHAERVRVLHEKGGATVQERDDADGRLQMARARVRQAQAALATTRAAVIAAEAAVTSAGAMRKSRAAELEEVARSIGFATLKCPFERGVVTSRALDPGALVRMDTDVILEVQRVDEVRAEFHVPERDVASVAVGIPVDLRFEALPDPVQGRVARTARALTRNKSMIVQVDLDNRDGRLLPGMFVYATMLLAVDDAALTLPASALRVDGDERFVFVVERGRARKVPIEVGADNGIRIQVDSGLGGDEQVIVAGDVKDGDAVTVEEARK